jgi:hypothetical protein
VNLPERSEVPRPLPFVYAYRDEEQVLAVDTRWRPRRVACTKDLDRTGPSEDYVVKYCHGLASACALISEVVCHGLLEVLRLRHLEAALVKTGSSWSFPPANAERDRGHHPGTLHFGTKLDLDLEPGPVDLDQLAAPEELIQVWCFDCWVMNGDRSVFGNLMMEPGEGGRWHLVPVDQSDCFLGSGSLLDGSYARRSSSHGSAPYLQLLERALLDLGYEPLEAMIDRIRRARAHVSSVVSRVPEEWWRASAVKPEEVRDCLLERADRVHMLVEATKWREVGHAVRGGLPFDV